MKTPGGSSVKSAVDKLDDIMQACDSIFKKWIQKIEQLPNLGERQVNKFVHNKDPNRKIEKSGADSKSERNQRDIFIKTVGAVNAVDTKEGMQKSGIDPSLDHISKRTRVDVPVKGNIDSLNDKIFRKEKQEGSPDSSSKQSEDDITYGLVGEINKMLYSLSLNPSAALVAIDRILALLGNAQLQRLGINLGPIISQVQKYRQEAQREYGVAESIYHASSTDAHVDLDVLVDLAKFSIKLNSSILNLSLKELLHSENLGQVGEELLQNMMKQVPEPEFKKFEKNAKPVTEKLMKIEKREDLSQEEKEHKMHKHINKHIPNSVIQYCDKYADKKLSPKEQLQIKVKIVIVVLKAVIQRKREKLVATSIGVGTEGSKDVVKENLGTQQVIVGKEQQAIKSGPWMRREEKLREGKAKDGNAKKNHTLSFF
ncbi:hypothetical protein MIDIC_230024 [Alphaproteobacteria bacterium]